MTEYVPVVTVRSALIVRTELPEPGTVGGLKPDVKPAGTVAPRVTMSANPLRAVIETVEVPEPPACTTTGEEAPMAKSGGAPTRTDMDAVWVSEPVVPVTVTV